MITKGYNKTISVWSDNESDWLVLKPIINKSGFDAVLCSNKDDVSKIPAFLIFARNNEIPTYYFSNHAVLMRRLKKGMIKLVLLDDKKPYNLYMDLDKVEIESIVAIELEIKKQAEVVAKINLRMIELHNKLHRIFYIYSELLEDKVFIDDILEEAGISRRTLTRDIKIIREVCLDKNIYFDDYDQSYSMR
jgi:hypothetical protein